MEGLAIGNGLQTVGTAPTTRGFKDLSPEDFFGLLIAELQSQDPLKPTDNEKLLAQLSNIRQMEQSSALNDTLHALAGEQRFGATTSLIGHYVSASLVSGAGDVKEVQGLVIGVRFESNGQAILELHNGQPVPADKVNQVTLVENLPPEILEKLQEELGILDPTDPAEDPVDEVPGEEDPAGEAGEPPEDEGLPIEPPNQEDLAAKAAAQGAAKFDVVGQLLDALFSPGISVKV